MTNLEKALKYVKLALYEAESELEKEYIQQAIIFLEESQPDDGTINETYKKNNPLGMSLPEIIERQQLGNKYLKNKPL